MSFFKNKVLYTIFSCLFIPILVYAEDISLNGILQGYYFSSTRNLDQKRNIFSISFHPQITTKFGSYLSLYSEARIIAENQRESIHSSMREIYSDIYLHPFNLRVGKQIIQWGRADGVNPTDNLTPWDYTLLFPEDGDLRSGIMALKINYYYGNTAFTGIYLPFFESNKFPLNYPVIEELPSKSFQNGQYAFKIDSTGGVLDWSLSYFDGVDPMPDLGLSTQGIIERYQRIKVIGGDFATILREFGVRGEMAYFFTEDMDGDSPWKKNPYFFYIFGVDKTLWEDMYLNLQFMQRIVTNYKDPLNIQDSILRDIAVKGAIINNQLDKVTNIVSLKIVDKMFYETLSTEISGIYNLTRRDYLIRPKIIYTLTDNLSSIIGTDIYKGKEDSFFGLLKDNTTFFGGIKYGF
ncbi:MAG: hypothetical protein AB1422_03280 [bacterium]